MRPTSLQALLESVRIQTRFPDEILIVDGSTNDETLTMVEANHYQNLQYFKVPEKHRGLTKQRNFGVEKVSDSISVVCFLDDDTILEPNYLEKITETFERNSDAVGVGGVAINENRWKENLNNVKNSAKYYVFGEHYIEESSRNYVRNILRLGSDKLPGVMPKFSHGRTYSYPLTGAEHPVNLLIGMSMNFRKEVFNNLNFSTYFEGYGLYEDAEFSLRAAKQGKLYINTGAQLRHFHDPDGRPNMFKYGEMVVRNGYYVWRVGHPDPDLKSKLKWHAITLLLTGIRFVNIFTTAKRKEAAAETFGRLSAYVTLFFNAPKP